MAGSYMTSKQGHVAKRASSHSQGCAVLACSSPESGEVLKQVSFVLWVGKSQNESNTHTMCIDLLTSLGGSDPLTFACG